MSLGLEMAGIEPVAHAEINSYASKVLHKHWPDVPNLGDVTAIDWVNSGIDLTSVDLIAGGSPCQDVSVGNKHYSNISTGAKSSLWFEFKRAIEEVEPKYVIFENVKGITKRGLDTVLQDLASLGYDAIWQVIPASAVGARHIRWRLFVLAYPNSERLQEQWRATPACTEYTTAQRGRAVSKVLGQSIARGAKANANLWKAEPSVGRMVDGVSNRVDRLRGLGNMVVPQVAKVLGDTIMVVDKLMFTQP